jgi:tetratricopeptide (TPR) repeat protein
MLSEFLARRALIGGLLARDGALADAERAVELATASVDRLAAHDDFLRGLGDARFMLGVLGLWRDDVEGGRASLEAAYARAVELGDESSLPLILRWRAYARLLAGDWDGGLRDADAGYEVAIQSGQPSQRAVLTALRGFVLAHLGRVADAREAAEEGLRLADATGAAFGTMLGLSTLGFLELSLGDAAQADRHLGPLVARLEAAGVREPGAVRFVPDAIEALVVLGRLDEAETLLVRLERRARKLDRASALAGSARCRALLTAARGDLASALSTLEVALAEHDRTAMPFERARSLLVLGEVRRRAKQKRAAREALEAALVSFGELGAELWVKRAQAEVSRIGGRAPTGETLTPVGGGSPSSLRKVGRRSWWLRSSSSR